MAGGRGVRLRPLTKYCPKPMVEVAGKPILERIILSLAAYGIKNLYISVNYLGEMIEDYFGDGQRFDCQIKYLKEKKYLHTGGSLSLIEEKIREPLIVMNDDLVTEIDFDHLLSFHRKGKFMATMVARLYDFEIPFGVIETAKNTMKTIQEKPTNSCLINAGIYVLSPEVLSLIPENKVFPLTKLFEKLLIKKMRVGAYRMKEEWFDVGRLADLDKAREELLSLKKNA